MTTIAMASIAVFAALTPTPTIAGELEGETPEAEESCFCDVARTEKEEMRKYLKKLEARQEADDGETAPPKERTQARS
ncbi:MAG: hypothetical protein VCB77_06275 [Alphaproteobacteria bacterium]